MKRYLYFFAILLSLALFVVYSFNHLNPELNNHLNPKLSPLEQKLIGEWYFSDPSLIEDEPNNSFTFSSDKKVSYKCWDKESKKYSIEKGTFIGKGDKLSMTITVSESDSLAIIFKQKVVFLNDIRAQFIDTDGSNGFTFEGFFYKAK